MLKIIQRYFFLFLNKNICYDPSLEPSRRDGSNDGSQIGFYGEIWLSLDVTLLDGSVDKMAEDLITF